MIRSELIDYLCAHGAAQTSHSGYTLWDHLKGVHRLLEASGAPDYLCEAGLFHSVYGTNAFKKITVNRECRDEVKKIIGEKAESLVWAFCNLPRPTIFEAALRQGNDRLPDMVAFPFDAQEAFVDLIHLECANLLEQKKLYEFPCLAKHAQVIGMLNRDGFSV